MFQKKMFQKTVECFRRILLKHSNVSEERPPANIDSLSMSLILAQKSPNFNWKKYEYEGSR
jgi:hypothetical protein